jgi:hypothetical protein
MRTFSFLVFFVAFASCTNNKDKNAEVPVKNSDQSKEFVIFGNRNALFNALKENDSLEKYSAPAYRFFWVAPSAPMVLFRLVNNGNTFTLNTKLFDYNSDTSSASYRLISTNEMVLSENDAVFIERKMYDAMFWNLKSDLYHCALDATFWDIEGFRKGKPSYNHIAIVKRKDGPVKEIYQLLVKKSGIKIEFDK